VSDMPRHHFRAQGADGARLSAGAINLCSYLWTFVPAKARAVGGFVFMTAERLALELELDKRTIERQLRQLRAAHMLRHGRDDLGRAGFVLLVLPRPEIADPPAGGGAANGSEIADPPVGDHRQSRAEIADNFCGDHRSVCLSPPSTEQEREQDREQDLTRARALAAAALTPPSAPRLGTSRHSLRGLIALLADGEPVDVIERVLRRASDIVARGLQQPAWFGTEMFFGGVWSRWVRALFELERLESAERDAAARAEAEAQAAQAAEAERERRAAELQREAEASQIENLARSLRARIAKPQPLTSFEIPLVESSRLERLKRVHPAAALAALEAALAAGAASLATVEAAILALPDSPDPSPHEARDEALEQLRAARQRAQRDGGNALEYLAAATYLPGSRTTPTLEETP
jgi:hypothetical protein